MRGSRGTRIGLVGFYGPGNVGDELFAQAFTNALADVGRVRTVAWPIRGIGDALRGHWIRQQDVIVIGGGDLIHLDRVSRVYWDERLLAKPVLVHGIGVAEYQGMTVSPEVVTKLRAFLHHPNVKRIGVRDTGSAEWIREWIDPPLAVEVDADPVLALDLPTPTPTTRPTIGVITRDRRGYQDDFTQVRRLIDNAMAAGYDVRRIVYGIDRVGQADAAVAEQIGPAQAPLVRSERLEPLMAAIGGCDALASMKFHGTVVATAYGVPSVCLMPTPKNHRFLRGIGRPELISHFEDPALPEIFAEGLPARIDPAVVAGLRADARAGLDGLQAAVRDVVDGMGRDARQR